MKLPMRAVCYVLLSGYIIFGVAGADFRTFDWGASRESVIAVEGKPANESGDTIAYEASVAGLASYLVFQFVNDKLSLSGYMFKEEHSNDSLFLSDFDKIEDLLKQRYGKPKDSRDVWLNDLYKDDPSHYGVAVAAGYLQKFSVWDTDRTTVTHSLRGDNFKVIHVILYQSKALEKLQEEAKRKSELDKL